MTQRLRHRLNPFLDIVKTAWENRDQLGYAYRILNKGVCDGCALGTTGMRDWTMDGIHLCWIRLNLLRLNTMPPLNLKQIGTAADMQKKPEKALREMGRLSTPLVRRRGQSGFTAISWDEAYNLMTERFQRTDPRRMAFYLVSRGTVNETYYAAQKAARFLGSNHIDNSARVCHAPSTTGLKASLGFAATTCSYKDMIGSDLVVFVGSNAANNQPVVMKYLHQARKQGTRIAMINTFREPGMEKYWVPSAPDSALFGTKICDEFFQIKPGGDIAFINGVLKHLIENNWLDEAFLAAKTEGWPELKADLAEQSFENLAEYAGAGRDDMLRFARLYAGANTAIFVWSMGITMHRHGVANVKAIANLALARGMVGRRHTGLMPIRGHSGVQGGAEVGAVPNLFPGGRPVNREQAKSLSREWGFPVPAWRGYYAPEMLDAAWEDKLDILYCAGSNLFGVLPDSRYVRRALQRIPFRVHHDIVLNPQMFVEPRDTVLLLPATTRYEMRGGNTETTTERRIIFNPEIPGPRIPNARDEWRVLTDIARRVRPAAKDQLKFATTQEIREEIARIVPFYAGIEALREAGDQVQWGGELLGADGVFGTESGKARFAVLHPPQQRIPAGWLQLSTRRGKQFNSMTFAAGDPLTNTGRKSVILAAEDLEKLGVGDGEPVLVRSETGEYEGIARSGPVHPGVVMMYWPEANILIRRGISDPECGIPAYRDTLVQVMPR